MGVISPVESSGDGRLEELRVSDNEGTPPVTLHVDQEVMVELDFIPSQSHPPSTSTWSPRLRRARSPWPRCRDRRTQPS
jgi:hypothetical protein